MPQSAPHCKLNFRTSDAHRNGSAVYRWPSYQAWLKDRRRQARERAARWRAKQKQPKRPITLKSRASVVVPDRKIIIQPDRARFRLRKSCGAR